MPFALVGGVALHRHTTEPPSRSISPSHLRRCTERHAREAGLGGSRPAFGLGTRYRENITRLERVPGERRAPGKTTSAPHCHFTESGQVHDAASRSPGRTQPVSELGATTGQPRRIPHEPLAGISKPETVQ